VFNFVGSYGKKSDYTVTAAANGVTVAKGACQYSYTLVQDPLGSISESTAQQGPCDAGSFLASADTARVCTLCPAGSYTSASGATSCRPAGAGKAIPQVGATADATTLCAAGTYGSPSMKAFMGPTDKVFYASCQPCAVDTYAPFPGMSECFTCKQGGAPIGGAPRCIAGFGGAVFTVEGADVADPTKIYDPNDQFWNTNYTLPAGYSIVLDGTGKPADNPQVVAYGDPTPGYATALLGSAAACVATSPNTFLRTCVYPATGGSQSLAAYVDANGEATISVLAGAACGTLDADGTANSITNQTAFYVGEWSAQQPLGGACCAVWLVRPAALSSVLPLPASCLVHLPSADPAPCSPLCPWPTQTPPPCWCLLTTLWLSSRPPAPLLPATPCTPCPPTRLLLWVRLAWRPRPAASPTALAPT